MLNVAPDQETIDLLVSQAQDQTCVWSVATFGAIAEYHGTKDAPITMHSDGAGLKLTSGQGGMQLTYHPDMRLIAYEGLSKIPSLWSQGISLCLPAKPARMRENTTVTALGPDAQAIDPTSQDMLRFDLGVGAVHMDACVRTDDDALIDLFAKYDGMPLFDGCDELIAALLHRSPTRVFSSALARIEVHTPIPASDSETPHGAHTHVLPELLAHGRAHAATIPIPEGWFPGLNLFPANPARNHEGNPKNFDLATHEKFQTIMSTFADPEVTAIKKAVHDAVLNGRSPETMDIPHTRVLRTALRVSLRQLRHTHGNTDVLEAWCDRFEVNSDTDSDTGDT